MIVLYWVVRGALEGLIWSNKPYKASTYHLLRLVEVLAVLGAIWAFNGVLTLLGETLVGIFLYERVNMKVSQNKWFKKEGEIFDIGIKIPRYKWHDWAILGVGLLSLLIGVF